MLNPSEMIPLMKDCDVVFHSAAFVAVEKVQEEQMWKITVEGTKSIVTAAIDSSENGTFFKHHAFEQPTSEPLIENRPLVSTPKHCHMIELSRGAKVVIDANEQGLEGMFYIQLE